MAKSSDPSAGSKVPGLPLDGLLSAVASASRWRILNELLKGHPLPVCEIATRLGASETAISKHMSVLLKAGIVRRHYGHYAIDSRYVVPGERTLDFGSIVMRFAR